WITCARNLWITFPHPLITASELQKLCPRAVHEKNSADRYPQVIHRLGRHLWMFLTPTSPRIHCGSRGPSTPLGRLREPRYGRRWRSPHPHTHRRDMGGAVLSEAPDPRQVRPRGNPVPPHTPPGNEGPCPAIADSFPTAAAAARTILFSQQLPLQHTAVFPTTRKGPLRSGSSASALFTLLNQVGPRHTYPAPLAFPFSPRTPFS